MCRILERVSVKKISRKFTAKDFILQMALMMKEARVRPDVMQGIS
jgi:hypothetical protein